MIAKNFWLPASAVVALGLTICLQGCINFRSSASLDETGSGITDFGKLQPGEFPEGWKSESTNPQDEPAQWEIMATVKDGLKATVLSITTIKDASKDHFNLCWTARTRMKDGTVSVRIRADAGQIDQGGGPIWRVMDANNYYLARYNPLEDNFRLYVVQNGKRLKLADAGGIKIRSGEWFSIKIVANGDRMEAWLNGKKLLEATDTTLPDTGGIGLWSKADAFSSFADFLYQTP